VECLPLRYEYDSAIYDASFKAAGRQALLVRIHTDAGISGVGEAASFGGPMASTAQVVTGEIAPRLIGEDPFRTERIWRKIYHMSFQHARGGIVVCAMSGVDIALWDIIGKATKQPLYKLLGGFKERAGAYASGGFYAHEKGLSGIVDEISGYVAKGFRAVKMKIGRNHSPLNPLGLMPDSDYHFSVEGDLERVEAVRKALGKDVELFVDANAAWDYKTALRAGRELDAMGVALFEEPVFTDDWQSSARLAAELTIPIAGYETEQLATRFHTLIENDCVDVVQPDLSWTGGITECRKIAAHAQIRHKSVAFHSFSSGILLAASLHALCAFPNGARLEFDQNPNGLRDAILDEPIIADSEGCVAVSDRPGLGVELNEDAVQEYLVDASAQPTNT
jgi:L-alanine-DL-glutamate epimerase-like enolase superfamily enzyme